MVIKSLFLNYLQLYQIVPYSTKLELILKKKQQTKIKTV